MVPLFMPVTSHNPTAVPMESHDQKGNLAPHFDLLELANAVVSLTILSALHDASSGTKCIT